MKNTDIGICLMESRSSYVALDIETTGLDPVKNKIIELAAIRVEEGVVTEKFSELVNPREWISGFITELTGITNDMLRTARTVEQVLPEFLDFVGDSVILGQNVKFDIGFIEEDCRELFGVHFSNDYMDTLRISRMLFKEYRHHRLCDQIERFGIGESVEHRALADAEQTHRCYEYMMNYMRENGITFEEKKKQKRELRAKDILPAREIDLNSPCCGKTFVFTGTLSRLSREQAMQHVVNGGGKVSDSVTKSTDFLVLGKNAGQTKSTKQKKAETLENIGILTEEDFLRRFFAER